MRKSSGSLGIGDARQGKHPDQSLLLAFIRGECSEHEKRIREHLATCEQCGQTFAALLQTSRTLGQLKNISRYLYYPELKPEQVLAHAKGGVPLRSAWTGRRKRTWHADKRRQASTRKSGFRLLSVPAAFALGLLLMTVIVVMAYTLVNLNGLPFFSGEPHPGPFIPVSPVGTAGVLPQLPSPSPTLVPTVIASKPLTPVVTASVSPTANSMLPSAFTISFCGKKQKKQLEICGNGFEPGENVLLIQDFRGANRSTTITPLIASDQGKIDVSWNIYSCDDLPLAIYVRDQTNASLASNLLTRISVPGCRTPTSTPVPGSSEP